MVNVKNLFGMAVMATALVGCSSNDNLAPDGKDNVGKTGEAYAHSQSICRQLQVLVLMIPSQVHLHLLKAMLRNMRLRTELSLSSPTMANLLQVLSLAL